MQLSSSTPVNSAANILFPCAHCRITLSVPASLAGITGPCPHCGNEITAPWPAPTHSNPPPPGLAVAAMPASSAQMPEVSLSSLLPQPAASLTGDAIRPEPRAVPARNQPVPVAPTIDNSRVKVPHPIDSEMASHMRKQSTPGRTLLRIAIPSTLLILLVIGFINLARFLNSNSLTQPAQTLPDTALKSPLDESITSKKVLPDSSPVKKPVPPLPQEPPVIPTPPLTNTLPTGPIKVTPHVTPPEVEKVPVEVAVEAGVDANRVVERFLAANSFDERMMYVLTHRTPAELQGSMLTYKWPSAQFAPGAQIPHPSERLTEFYYEVRFGENSVGFPSEATLLVHKRADEEPKIILEPLLDTVGGRLLAYAKEPTSKPQDFYVIMDARVKCFDDTIPNAFKKCTFFLRAHTTGTTIATAYCNESSITRQQFDNPLTGLKWKNPMPVVVTLQWNTTEDYSRPFLEVIEIKSQSWNH